MFSTLFKCFTWPDQAEATFPPKASSHRRKCVRTLLWSRSCPGEWPERHSTTVQRRVSLTGSGDSCYDPAEWASTQAASQPKCSGQMDKDRGSKVGRTLRRLLCGCTRRDRIRDGRGQGHFASLSESPSTAPVGGLLSPPWPLPSKPTSASNSSLSRETCPSPPELSLAHSWLTELPGQRKGPVCSLSKDKKQLGVARSVSCKRLMREFRDLRHKQSDQCEPPFTVDLVDDSLREWDIRIHHFDSESQISDDMRQHCIPYVHLHASLPDSYPFEPPFVRVVSPYIEKGFVMQGGAICLELLTKTGWTSAYTMEAVIVQLMASLVKGGATIAVSKNAAKCFSHKSAYTTFKNIVKIHHKHGWVDAPLYEG